MAVSTRPTEILEDEPPIDWATLNPWEHAAFLCALWTEICMAFPALDALREGDEVYPGVDAIGGAPVEASVQR